MTKRDEAIPVLFRADRTRRRGAGDRVEITAVFPTLPGTVGDRDSMTCYAHIGQHSACSSGWIREKTWPAKPDEYRDLLAELESIGYRLRIVKRISRKMDEERSPV